MKDGVEEENFYELYIFEIEFDYIKCPNELLYESKFLLVSVHKFFIFYKTD